MKKQVTMTSFYTKNMSSFGHSERACKFASVDPELVDIIVKMLKVLRDKMERLNVSDYYLYEPFIYFNDETKEGVINTLKSFGFDNRERDQYVMDFIRDVNEAHDYLDAKASVC